VYQSAEHKQWLRSLQHPRPGVGARPAPLTLLTQALDGPPVSLVLTQTPRGDSLARWVLARAGTAADPASDAGTADAEYAQCGLVGRPAHPQPGARFLPAAALRTRHSPQANAAPTHSLSLPLPQALCFGALPAWLDEVLRILPLPQLFPAELGSRRPLFDHMLVRRSDSHRRIYPTASPHRLDRPAMKQVANRDAKDSGWEIAHAVAAAPADFPRHDGSPYRGPHVRRGSLGFIHRTILAPCQTLELRHSQLFSSPSRPLSASLTRPRGSILR
jgi:hypothetical protein